jgi:hypothetical protein
MEEVLEEAVDTLVVDVAADNNKLALAVQLNDEKKKKIQILSCMYVQHTIAHAHTGLQASKDDKVCMLLYISWQPSHRPYSNRCKVNTPSG